MRGPGLSIVAGALGFSLFWFIVDYTPNNPRFLFLGVLALIAALSGYVAWRVLDKPIEPRKKILVGLLGAGVFSMLYSGFITILVILLNL